MDRKELKVHVLRARSISTDDYSRFGSFYIRLNDKIELTGHYDHPAKKAQVPQKEKVGDNHLQSGKMVDLVKLEYQDRDCFIWKEILGAQDKSTK